MVSRARRGTPTDLPALRALQCRCPLWRIGGAESAGAVLSPALWCPALPAGGALLRGQSLLRTFLSGGCPARATHWSAQHDGVYPSAIESVVGPGRVHANLPSGSRNVPAPSDALTDGRSHTPSLHDG